MHQERLQSFALPRPSPLPLPCPAHLCTFTEETTGYQPLTKAGWGEPYRISPSALPRNKLGLPFL